MRKTCDFQTIRFDRWAVITRKNKLRIEKTAEIVGKGSRACAFNIRQGIMMPSCKRRTAVKENKTSPERKLSEVSLTRRGPDVFHFLGFGERRSGLTITIGGVKEKVKGTAARRLPVNRALEGESKKYRKVEWTRHPTELTQGAEFVP